MTENLSQLNALVLITEPPLAKENFIEVKFLAWFVYAGTAYINSFIVK